MASLKEIKTRMSSVRSTLKITSAMKMVASAKLHRVQGQAQALAEYDMMLSSIAAAMAGDSAVEAVSELTVSRAEAGHAVVVACSSDGSLCGAFNSNVIRALDALAGELRGEGFSRITVIPIGGKIAAAAVGAGYETVCDYVGLAAHPDYGAVAALADSLADDYAAGRVDRVYTLRNHFYSMGHQAPVKEIFLPMDTSKLVPDDAAAEGVGEEYIFEPEARILVGELLPYALRTRLFSLLLDSATAEHAARTVAMQTASDNAGDLLDELSLTYNKQRQQAITAELADMADN